MEAWSQTQKLDVNAVIIGNSSAGVPGIPQPRGVTLVHVVLQNRNQPSTTLKAYVQLPNAELNARDATGQTPLLFLINHAVANWPGMGDILLEAGVYGDASDQNGISPLWIAVKLGKGHIVASLLQYEAYPDTLRIRDQQERSVLFYAACNDLLFERKELLP
jgi:ankyrin repeat protein